MNTYELRRKKFAESLKENGIAMAMFEDAESRRDTAIRYFSGQPSDAVLFISSNAESMLVPWDENMANKMASVDTIINYAEFKRDPIEALVGAIEKFKIPLGSTIDIPSVTSYPRYIDFVAKVPDYELRCSENASGAVAVKMRAAKDEAEIEIYRKVSEITDRAMDEIEKSVRSGEFKTETDIALFIEKFLRENDCEKAGFDTLAAGPSRSFAIHCFPTFTASEFGTNGMSILDFGLCYKGYTSDVTMSFVRGPQSQKQKQMIRLVRQTHDWAISQCKIGAVSRDIALGVEKMFAAEGFYMPHSLGHGIGLEIHESPALTTRESNDWVFEKGHIVTVEPGLYDPKEGGVRWEDDILITEAGFEKLTHSRIVEID